MSFSAEGLAKLYKAGWTEDRRIDTLPFEQLYRENHLPVFPSVLEFLSRFGDLVIRCLKDDQKIDLQIGKHPYYLKQDIIAYQGKDLKDAVSPVGVFDHSCLLMNEAGNVILHQEEPFLVGMNAEEAIEKLCQVAFFYPVPDELQNNSAIMHLDDEFFNSLEGFDTLEDWNKYKESDEL